LIHPENRWQSHSIFGGSGTMTACALDHGVAREQTSAMSIALNHTIVPARDPQASAVFLAEMLGLPAPVRFGPFHGVALDNGVTLDFQRTDEDVEVRHFAFLVSEAEFDSIFGRIRERGLTYWADPFKRQPGAINHHDGGRGVYWDDPDGHRLEIITRPYGSGG
jgi:catechol 2,3-dioxygenase-like lactoylglutathione lyase family enzyme